MLLPHLTKLLPIISLVVTVIALPTSPSAIDTAAIQDCESDYARCSILRMDLAYCRAHVCSSHGNECKSCQTDAFPVVTDPPVTKLTSDNTAVEVQVLDSRAGARPPRNHCIVICTHAYCDLLCTNPGHPPSAADGVTEVATNADASDLLELTDAQPNQLGVPLTEGMTTVITTVNKDSMRQVHCMWICSGKVNCRRACWDAGDDKGALVEDAGPLPEGMAVDGMGDCKVVEKGDVGPLTVCQVPENVGGGALTAGDWDPTEVRCVIYWIGIMSQLICYQVATTT